MDACSWGKAMPLCKIFYDNTPRLSMMRTTGLLFSGAKI
jgi:hypothetical protein